MGRKAAAVIGGSFILAVGMNLFYIPYELMDGGFVGIALILNYLWKVRVGFAVILFSLPIFIWAWNRNRSFFYNSLHGMLISSFLIDLLHEVEQKWMIPKFGPEPFPPLVSAITGGLLVGTGIGIMLRHHISTGGSDLLAQFVAEVLSINVGIVIFIMDIVVISIGSLLLTGETLLLSIIAILAVAISTSMLTEHSRHETAQ